MKLTKAQRLFIKAGIEMCEYTYYKWIDNCEVLSDIVEHRKKYKELIREALEEWETEEAAAYGRGYKDGIYDN